MAVEERRIAIGAKRGQQRCRLTERAVIDLLPDAAGNGSPDSGASETAAGRDGPTLVEAVARNPASSGVEPALVRRSGAEVL